MVVWTKEKRTAFAKFDELLNQAILVLADARVDREIIAGEFQSKASLLFEDSSYQEKFGVETLEVVRRY